MVGVFKSSKCIKILERLLKPLNCPLFSRKGSEPDFSQNRKVDMFLQSIEPNLSIVHQKAENIMSEHLLIENPAGQSGQDPMKRSLLIFYYSLTEYNNWST